MDHPIIKLFEERAFLLDTQQSAAGLDDAIAKLAGWMDLVRGDLTEDDWAVLGEIGGLMYREGLERRAQKTTRRWFGASIASGR